MIPDFSIQIEFNKNHSKFYLEVIRLCQEFDEFTSGEKNVLKTNRDEVYAKWDQFNRIFWKSVDWKGNTLTYNGNTFGSHADKTRVFYAVQDNKLNHLCALVEKIKSVRNAYPAKEVLNITAEDFMQICN
nr:hypothetical protein [uncultured Draconibacterium sp.]